MRLCKEEKNKIYNEIMLELKSKKDINSIRAILNSKLIDNKYDYQYLTELSRALGDFKWKFYGKNNELFSAYCKLWNSIDRYIIILLKEDMDKLSYYAKELS